MVKYAQAGAQPRAVNAPKRAKPRENGLLTRRSFKPKQTLENDMAFDGIVLHAVIGELSGLLAGGRIEKIFQTGAYEITLLVHAGGEHYRLLLSADPATAGLHLTRRKSDNPTVCPPFAMVLRKYLTGAHLLSVTQSGFDRVAVLEFETRGDLGDLETKRLIIEIMNRQSNIILVNGSGVIHDAIRHADESVNRYREILPARPYVAPPAQDKTAPDSLSQALISDFLTDPAAPGKNASGRILALVSGFSPLLCDCICRSVELDPKKPAGALTGNDAEKLAEKVMELAQKIGRGEYFPAIFPSGEMHCLEICAQDLGVSRKFNTVNMMLDNYFSAKAETAAFERRKSGIAHIISANTEKITAKIREYREMVDAAADADRQKQLGELLTANLYRLPEYAETARVTDYYTEGSPEVEIELNPSRTVAENAQQFFKKYKKQRSAGENGRKLLEKTLPELEYLENVGSMLSSASSMDELADIEAELREQQLTSGANDSARRRASRDSGASANMPWSAFSGGRPASKKSRREKAKAARARSGSGSAGAKGGKNGGAGGAGASGASGTSDSDSRELSKPLTRYAPDGTRIRIGKNSRQNERLTLREAADGDLWLHLHGAPGSHVILCAREKGGQISDESLLAAAELAAYYSSARGSTKADVDYTPVKNVKKLPGGRPGLVTYTDYKTVTVRPRDNQAESDQSPLSSF